jgi:hypothetical protein
MLRQDLIKDGANPDQPSPQVRGVDLEGLYDVVSEGVVVERIWERVFG